VRFPIFLLRYKKRRDDNNCQSILFFSSETWKLPLLRVHYAAQVFKVVLNIFDCHDKYILCVIEGFFVVVNSGHRYPAVELIFCGWPRIYAMICEHMYIHAKSLLFNMSCIDYLTSVYDII